MSNCQGRRLCAFATAALAAQAVGFGLNEAAMPRCRFPVKPVTLEEIALSRTVRFTEWIKAKTRSPARSTPNFCT
jgi:hypothetical protein